MNDTRTMLGLPSVEVTDETRILLMELDGYVQGMLVDGVAEIVKFKASDIEAAMEIRPFAGLARKVTSCTSCYQPTNS